MNTSSKQSWHVTLLDTGDGSGDAFLPLPDELMVLMGWTTDDILSIEYVGNCIKLTKKLKCECVLKDPRYQW
ncbi:MAG: hypothetical protein ACO1N8_03040 [Methylophilus sp.]